MSVTSNNLHSPFRPFKECPAPALHIYNLIYPYIIIIMIRHQCLLLYLVMVRELHGLDPVCRAALANNEFVQCKNVDFCRFLQSCQISDEEDAAAFRNMCHNPCIPDQAKVRNRTLDI